jgi:arylsulfatase A-like enzyme
MDTQRVDRLGCYGYERSTTPRLDAFAADATVFENCTSPGIWTLPSHTSMFTGLFPSEHGANWNHLWVNDEFPLLAEHLKAAGYQTMALSNNPYVGPATNLARGFDGFINPLAIHAVRGNALSTVLAEALYPSGYVGKWLGVATAQDDGAKFTNQLVRRFFDCRDPNRPFFLFINYMETHAPFLPPLPYKQLFVGSKDLDGSYRCAWWCKRSEFSLLKQDCFSRAQLQLLSDTYDAETRLQDDYLGDLLETVAERAGLAETLVIITADHGECLGEDHILGHAWTVCDTLAHVPLIVHYPKRLKPGRRADLVQTVDLLPTILDAVHGQPVPTRSTFGQSLLDPRDVKPGSTPTEATRSSTLPAAMPTGRVVVVEYLAPYDLKLDEAQKLDSRFDRTPFERSLRAIRQGPWKYVVGSDGSEALYNVEEDPGETDNMIGTHRPIADHMSNRLAEWLAASKPYKVTSSLDGSHRLDDATRRRLRDLGYIQ